MANPLDALLRGMLRILRNGVAQPSRDGLDFRGDGVTVEDTGAVITVTVPGNNGTLDHNALNNLTVGNPHTQYVPTTRTVGGTSPVTINGVASATLAGDVTIAVTAATTSAAGSMSAVDKSKLDGVAAGATNTPLSSATPQPVGVTAVVGASTAAPHADHVHAHGTHTNGTLHAAATNTYAGFVPTVGASGTFLRSTGTASQWATVAWADIATKPTTLSGYGITDGVVTSSDATLATLALNGATPSVTIPAPGSDVEPKALALWGQAAYSGSSYEGGDLDLHGGTQGSVGSGWAGEVRFFAGAQRIGRMRGTNITAGSHNCVWYIGGPSDNAGSSIRTDPDAGALKLDIIAGSQLELRAGASTPDRLSLFGAVIFHNGADVDAPSSSATAYTLTASDRVVLLDTASGGITATISGGEAGRIVEIVNTGAGANVVTLAAGSGITLRGSTGTIAASGVRRLRAISTTEWVCY